MGKVSARLLSRASSTGTKTLAFLNTSLGLWLLSSVGLGTLTFLYTQFDALSKRDAEDFSRIRALQLEVLQRVEQYESYNSQIAVNPENVPSAASNKREGQYQAVLFNLLSSPAYQEKEGARKPIVAASPEYRERTLVSLVGELRVREIQRKAKKLPSLDAVVALNPDFSSYLPSSEMAKKVREAFSSAYWLPIKNGESAP